MTPITILVCALGGEGGGVMAEWLVETAAACGHSAQGTSIPGVAQRTGATTYYIEIWPQPDARLDGRRPVFGPSPVPGALDVLLSSELLEAARQTGAGFVSPERTLVLAAAGRVLTTAEKLAPGDGRYADDALRRVLEAHSRRLRLIDVQAIAREAATLPGAVLLGALAASDALPFAREAYEATIRASGTGVASSLRGFDAAYAAVAAGDGPARAPRASTEKAAAIPAAAFDFPPSVRDLLALGHARVLEYQDAAYAALYLQRLRRVLAADTSADHATTREVARWLALWMAFDDIARVAELKARASRHVRVRREVGARDDELLRIYDHLKPGVPEFAALLPPRLAAALLRWDRRRETPFALPLKLASHGVAGLLALRLLAATTRLRRFGSRYAEEQALIERWLAAVERGARLDPRLGHELALCGRLIKGYGATQERGKANLLHVLEHLGSNADAVRAAREAALVDTSGRALDAALAQHRAPPRPAREQPIRWQRRPRSTLPPRAAPSTTEETR
jgi:indolepyruvate ferredoxin oxidoreductase beta subunit